MATFSFSTGTGGAFGTPAATAPAPAPGTGGFGTAVKSPFATTSMSTTGGGFGGFGAAPAPGTTAANPFGAAATPGAFGATATAGLGAGAMAAPPPAPDSNVPVTAETSFAQLPQAMQQKVWEAHRLVMEHRKHAEAISRFSTQDYGLDQHTKKLKLDILRVQNAHSELGLAAGELRKDVERLRGYLHRLQQASDNGGGGGQQPQQQPQQQQGAGAGQEGGAGGYTEMLREMVGQFEARLAEYDAHVHELYRKVVPARAAVEGPRPGGIREAAHRQVTPDQLAALIRMQNEALLKVAAQVAGVHEMVERVRSEWNSRTGQDPFEELDRLAAEEEERKRKAARLVVPAPSSSAPSQAIFQLGGAAQATPAALGAPLLLGGPSPATPAPAAGGGGGLFGGLAPQQSALPFGGGTQTTGFFGQSDTGVARKRSSKGRR